MPIDINCDLAEGMGIEAQIMPYISSANIACALHAGNPSLMVQTAQLCMQHGVNIGAHPGFWDKENFGRTVHALTPEEIYHLMLYQLGAMSALLKPLGATLHHIKTHGALYNLSAQDKATSRAIATAVRDFNPQLKLYGLAGSVAITEAQDVGLSTIAEGFVDRTYTATGQLTPRSHPRAVHSNIEDAVQQALNLVRGQVQAVSGEMVTLGVETLCLHGDGKHAIELARAVQQALIGSV